MPHPHGINSNQQVLNTANLEAS